MNKSLGQCLEMYRLRLGWDKNQASGETGFVISQQQISKFERGSIKNPGILSLIPLLAAYGKSLNDLEKDMADKVTPYHQEMTIYEGNTTIPLITIRNVTDYLNGKNVTPIDHLPIKNQKTRKLFALKMDNDFMASNTGSGYPKNSLVIFDAAKTFAQGKDMLISNPDGLIFRDVFKEGSSYYFKKLNTGYPTINNSDQFKMIARAIECRIIIK